MVLETGECVNIQGFAIAAQRAKIRRTAGNCANFRYRKICDSKKSGFGRQIEISDIAGRRAITFFGTQAFSGNKKSSPA
jgi:hypothetical protein